MSRRTRRLKREVKLARKDDVPDGIVKRVIQFARQGYTTLDFDTYDTDWESEAYLTVSGQNSNNSVRVTDAFLHAVETDADWDLTWRLSGKTAKTVKARELWEKIGYAAWASADPGIQYHTTINDWHTCPASGPIRASNPCSEYMFLDDTACNLASLNLLQFLSPETKVFDIVAYEHAVRLVDADARNLGRDGAVPVARDRPALLRVPHARPRLRQHRRAPDVLRHPLRFGRGAGDLRRAVGGDDRPRLCDFGGACRQDQRLPRLQAERRGDAARHPQPQARRRRRGFRLREPVGRPDPARPRLARQGRPGLRASWATPRGPPGARR